MRILILGTGGLGGYFGARLAASGADVTFVARGEHLTAMRANGLRIESALGNLLLKPVTASDDPTSAGVVDLVMIGVKLWDTESAVEALAPAVGPDTAVVSFQNGVDTGLLTLRQQALGARRALSVKFAEREPL